MKMTSSPMKKKGLFVTISLIIFLIQTVVYGQQNINWAQSINANDPPWPGYENLNINKGVRVSDGFLICGTSYKAVFPSRNGDSIGRTNWGGPFVAKYDFSGNLIWLDYGIDSNYAALSAEWSNISSVAADSLGNVYICGTFGPQNRFYYNGGAASVRISEPDTSVTTYSPNSFVAKLNAQGVPQWHTRLYGSTPNFIANCANRGIILAGSTDDYNVGYVNGHDSVVINGPTYQTGSQFIYWIDTDGHMKHHVITTEQVVNVVGFLGLETDKEGNAIVAGEYEHSITFRNAGNTDSVFITGDVANNIYGFKFYAVKYDTMGNIVWHVSDRYAYTASQSLNGSNMNSLSVAPNGTVYISVEDQGGETDTTRFINADSSITIFKTGEKTIYKVTKNGHLDWSLPFHSNYYNSIYGSDSEVVYSGTRQYQSEIPPDYTDTVYSLNNSSYKVVHAIDPNVYFLKVDTNGNIINTGIIGKATGPLFYKFNGLFPSAGASYIMVGNVKGYDDVEYCNMFHDTMYLNGEDGFMLNYAFNSGDTVGIPFHAPSLTITGLSADTICAKNAFKVFDSISGDFFQYNDFKVQITNANGYFPSTSSPSVSMSVTALDSFICTLPSNITTNTYKLRLISDNPTSYSNAVPLYIIRPDTANLLLETFPGTTINAGTFVTFVALPVNGGETPIYEWYKNDVLLPAETNDSLITNQLVNGDVIKATMLSNKVCVLGDTISKSVVMHVTGGTGINEHGISLDELIAYPNPSAGEFFIAGNLKNAGNLIIDVKDILGTSVYHEEISSTNLIQRQIHLPGHLSSGIYLLQMQMHNDRKNIQLSILK